MWAAMPHCVAVHRHLLMRLARAPGGLQAYVRRPPRLVGFDVLRTTGHSTPRGTRLRDPRVAGGLGSDALSRACTCECLRAAARYATMPRAQTRGAACSGPGPAPLWCQF